MATIYHQVWINAPVAKVYDALSTAEGISNWWDKQTAVETATGQVLEHNPGPMHGVVKLKVLELVPDKHKSGSASAPIPKPVRVPHGRARIFVLTSTREATSPACPASAKMETAFQSWIFARSAMTSTANISDTTTSLGGVFCKNLKSGASRGIGAADKATRPNGGGDEDSAM